jgi:hypothetical protein
MFKFLQRRGIPSITVLLFCFLCSYSTISEAQISKLWDKVKSKVSQKQKTSSTNKNKKMGDKNFILDLLKKQPDKFGKVLDSIAKYRVQIIYTQIDRNRKNIPSFKEFSYRLNPAEYYYPASTVKLPVLCMALEKLNNLKIEGLNKYTRLQIGTSHSCQTAVLYDSTSENRYPSIAHYIKKILLVSDNDSYNRLYEFLGPQYINARLKEMGYANAAVIRRFSTCSVDENRFTNPFTFFDSNGNIIYAQDAKENPNLIMNPSANVKIGNGYLDDNGTFVKGPMDFSGSNCLNLSDLNEIMKSVIFPEVAPANHKFNLTPDDYKLVYKYMSMFPSEAVCPAYVNAYYDSWKKYFIYGGTQGRITNKYIRIFNIVGMAYGFLIDCAYIVDFKTSTEFMLTAVIYVNEDGILNDDKYEYFTVGMPFLSELGKTIYEHEKKRKKKSLPDLEKFKVN